MKNLECPYCEEVPSTVNTERGLVKHVNRIHNVSTEEFYIKRKLNGVTPTCKCGCGEPVKFQRWDRGFNKYVNQSHTKKKSAKVIKECLECGEEFESYKSKNQEFCSKECVNASSEIVDRRKQTMVDKYGVEHPMYNEEFVEKQRQSIQNLYGVDNPFEAEDVKKKIKETNLEKYGVVNPMLSEDIKNKVGITKLKRYGDSLYNNVGQQIQTNLDKYGANSYTMTEEGKEKIKQTSLEKYGVDNPSKNPEIIKGIKKNLFISFFKRLLESDRLKEKVIPLFSIDDYKGVSIENTYSFKCAECSHEFEDHLDNGRVPRCIKCYPIQSSNSEKEVIKFVESLGVKVIENNRTIIAPYELDLYLPDYNIAIELNGLYWHSEIGGGKDKYYHLNKTKSCYEQGIQLIHIYMKING